MITPSMTMRPIACGHVILGAMANASRALSPRPVGDADRKAPDHPHENRVITPATKAVAAATKVRAVLTFAPITAPEASL